ncbi:MAG: response regulator [Myxococcales bacterium]
MTRILTVDDSRAVRNIVAKEVRALGFEIDEAEDGQQGLAKLEEVLYDLVLLDVNMPVLDGPGMLAKMRELGNQTPVIMLTSESKRSIVAGALKLGLVDYILKPFKAEDLRAKLLTVLKVQAGGGAGGAGGPAAEAGPPAAAPISMAAGAPMRDGSPKQFIDILLIDDMENVGKRLRSMIPTHITMNSVSSGQAAIATCRERVYQVIVVDTTLPDVNSSVLASQLQVLQPHAAILALLIQAGTETAAAAKPTGFVDVLHKPFHQDKVEDFLLQYFNKQEVVTTLDNVVKLSQFTGKADRIDRYFDQAAKLGGDTLTNVAAAAYEETIIDLSLAPPDQARLPKLVCSLKAQAGELGMALKVVAPPEIRKVLDSFEETRAVPSVSAA